MKLRIVTVTAFLSLLPAGLPTRNHEHAPFLVASAEAAATPQASGDPCAFPTPTRVKGMSDAEVAWRLFVAATCPVANDPNAVVKLEQWEEQ